MLPEMKSPIPMFRNVPIPHLIEDSGYLFKALIDHVSEYYQVSLTDLFTWDQIDHIVDSGVVSSFPESLQIKIEDYISGV